MTSLTFNESKPREHLGILLYGPEGEGKSTAAASAPGPIIYCNADRPGAIRFARRHFPKTEFLELPIDGKRVLEELFVELRSGKLDAPGTLVLDSLGRIYDVVLNEIAGGGKPTLPQRGDANTFIERYILALLELPMHLVLVAHDNPVVVGGSEEDGTANIELFPFTGTNNPGLAKKIMRALDIVGYCGHRPVPEDSIPEELPPYMHREDDDAVREFVAQLYRAGGRRAKETTGVLGKSAPLDLSMWIDQVNAIYQSSPPAGTNGAKAAQKNTTQKERVTS